MNTLLLLFPQLTNVKHRSHCPTVMFTEPEFMGQRCVNDWGHSSQLWLWTLPRAWTIRSVCQVPKVGLYEIISAFKQQFDPHPESNPILWIWCWTKTNPFLHSRKFYVTLRRYSEFGLRFIYSIISSGETKRIQTFLTMENQVIKM